MSTPSRNGTLLQALVAVACVCLSGCSSSRNRQMEQAKDKGLQPLEFSVGKPAPPKEEPPKLMVFGGEGHDVYLGCLSCDAREPESVFNEFGTYGTPYSPYSLWNALTPYGSVSSPISPRNPTASNPPVVRDHRGNFHGYLTINSHMPQVHRSHEADVLLKRIQDK